MDKTRSNHSSRAHSGKATLLATVSLLGTSLGVMVGSSAGARDNQSLTNAKQHFEYKPGGNKTLNAPSTMRHAKQPPVLNPSGSTTLNAPSTMRHAKQPPVLNPSGSTTLNAATGPSKSLTQPNSLLGTGGVPAVTSGAKTGNSGTTKR